MKARIVEPRKKKRKINLTKFAFVLLSIVLVFIAYEIVMFCIGSRDVGIKYKDYDNTGIAIEYDVSQCPYESNKEIKRDLDRLFGTSFYIYVEKDNMGHLQGQIHLLIRLIKVQSGLSKTQYCYTLAHELTHLVHCSLNETYTEFMAFKTLYESGNDWFKEVAKMRADNTIRGHSKTVYDCGYYMIEYLKGVDNGNKI